MSGSRGPEAPTPEPSGAQDLLPRTGDLEWAMRVSRGEAPGLLWADADLAQEGEPHRVVRSPSGAPLFHAYPYHLLLPPPMLEAAVDSQQSGHPPLEEGILLTFAWPDWFVQTRRLLWGGLTPVPRILAWLAESYGFSGELHRNDPERLARIVVRLPTFFPTRGQLSGAIEILEATTGEPVTGTWLQSDSAAASPDLLRQEALPCRPDTWWAERSGGAAPPEYRFEGGFLRFQPRVAPPWALRREDILWGWQASVPPRPELFRLLPAWISVRVAPIEDAKP